MKKKHHFTLNGEPITAVMLAGTMDISTNTLYALSDRHHTDVGEELAEHHKTTPQATTAKTIVMGGEEITVIDLAEQLGVKTPTLLSRMRMYGEDNCLTYWPGPIPSWLTKSKLPQKAIDETGNEEWKSLGIAPRFHNIKPLGSWEKSQLQR